MEPEQKRWIQQHVEGVPATVAPTEQHHILDRLNAAEAFERFLHTRYVGQKRFGLEGAESTIVLLDTLLDEAAAAGLTEAVLGMAHRGRLNVLANIVGKSYGEIFGEFEGNLDPESVQGSGDVKYHKGPAEPSSATRARRSTSLWPPTRPTSRRSTRSSRASCAPSRIICRHGLGRSRVLSCSSSTATPLSPGRASSPRRSTCPSSPATAPAARSTS